MGMREAAVALAKPTLLEPIMELEVSVPDDFVGDVMGNLNSRRGRVAGVDRAWVTMQSIKAQVPMAEVLTYASDLTSITGGQGAFTMEFSHYSEVPREPGEGDRGGERSQGGVVPRARSGPGARRKMWTSIQP